MIGAGPSGLELAVHFLQKNSSVKLCIFEKGSQVGSNISLWQNVQLFSPWKLNVSKEGEKVLSQTNSEFSTFFQQNLEKFPLGSEYIAKYLKPLEKYLTDSKRVTFHFNTKVKQTIFFFNIVFSYYSYSKIITVGYWNFQTWVY